MEKKTLLRNREMCDKIFMELRDICLGNDL